MAKYNTVQREQLMSFLTANKSQAMTVVDITNGMRQSPDTVRCPAESTVYRLIKQLVEEGVVKRTVNGCSREFLYQIVEDEDCHNHLHMKCKICGKMLHMDNEMSEQLIDRLFEQEGFYLDQSMVLMGVCKDCKG